MTQDALEEQADSKQPTGPGVLSTVTDEDQAVIDTVTPAPTEEWKESTEPPFDATRSNDQKKRLLDAETALRNGEITQAEFEAIAAGTFVDEHDREILERKEGESAIFGPALEESTSVLDGANIGGKPPGPGVLSEVSDADASTVRSVKQEQQNNPDEFVGERVPQPPTRRDPGVLGEIPDDDASTVRSVKQEQQNNPDAFVG